jgi:integration host factor subunit beta
MQLVETLAKKENLTLKAAESIINIIFDAMTEALIRGDRVEIRGFGSFMVKDYDGYRGHNPRTGASIEVAPKKLPFFKVGKDLKEMVDR